MNTIEEIISSLRIAMTDARQNESHFESWMILNEAICDAIDALTEQPAQQEPVAWKNAALRVGEDLCSVGPFGYYDMTAEQWLDWALSVVTVHAPPQEQQSCDKRKPLLASDIVTMYNENPRSDSEMIEFARAIEAAHQIYEDKK